MPPSAGEMHLAIQKSKFRLSWMHAVLGTTCFFLSPKSNELSLATLNGDGQY